LNWKTENANDVSIDQNIGRVEGNSSIKVTPTANTTYTLTAKGSGGAPAQQSVAITVTAPPEHPVVKIAQFKANPPSIKAGDSTTLLWITQNASDVSIDQGIGTVVAGDSQQVTPSQTTTYTLTANGQGGDLVKKSVTVTVSVAVAVKEKPTTSSSSEAKQCLDRFKDAYESLSPSELQKVWISFNNKRRKAYEDSIKGAQAIRLQDDQCTEPSVSEDTLRFQCSETMTYQADHFLFCLSENGRWELVRRRPHR
jgi:hypothetical protein